MPVTALKESTRFAVTSSNSRSESMTGAPSRKQASIALESEAQIEIALFARFQALLDDEPGPVDVDLGEPLLALAGVREFPSRIKCATLAWHTMISATADRDTAPVTTE